ncbi:hypothetical protein E9229_003958 [Paeniglutamicibacter cryotolerans]|uniref:Uncharacterized protein n=1 Tax=Paeniglutamicibacter cryotolerans TaxID=670079 RepID=A0A839QSM3_9MICC|nr:hypothetical protein [Paeniglutamicibacter cryotolerans]
MTDTAIGTPPIMGLAEAARECGISVSTLRRRKEALVTAGATVSPKGWEIPIPALVALGYLGSTTPPPASPVTPATKPPGDARVEAALIEVDSLRARLADAEQRAAVAEAIAGERERVIQAQAATLRMLERGTPAGPAESLPDTSDDGYPDNPATAPVKVPLMAPDSRPKRWLSFGRRR